MLNQYFTFFHSKINKKKCGAEGDRSPDLPHAKRTLYH